MSVIKSNGAGSGASGFYNGVATQSLRLNDDDDAHLKFDPSGAGNQKTWTCSAWVKRSKLGANHNTGDDMYVFNTFTAGNNANCVVLGFRSDAPFFATYNLEVLKSNRLLRDIGAWYHIMWVLDTTQGTASNRLKIYINGTEETSFATDNRANAYLNQNEDLALNNGNEVRVGTSGASANPAAPLDGYIAEFNFVDGTALDPTYFGETKNGVWIPKKYTGSYGTNGFRLEFKQTGTGTASASTIGADTSGEGNHLTSTNLVASDSNIPDCPENNFSTMNTLDKVDLVLAEGNLKTTGAGNSFDTVRSTFAMPSGSWYAEFLCHAGTGNGNNHVGISTQSEALSGISGSNFLGSSATSYSYSDNDNVYNNGSITNSTGTTYTAGDIIGVTFTGSEIKWYKNNSLIATVSSITGNDYCFTTTSYSTSMGMFANFGQDSSFAGAKTAQGNTDGNGIGDFYYAPPSGFLAMCSANLDDDNFSTIGPNSTTQSADHFNTVLYSGNGGSNAISGVGFQPDWIWIKNRSQDNQYHNVYDSSRGTTRLYPNDTNTQEAGHIASYDSDGFTLNTDNTNSNGNGTSYVSWNWKANGGTTVTNTDGSIDSTVQANTTAGFSIVTFEGNDTKGATIGHGLGVKPDLIIMKGRDQAISWVVWFPKFQENNQLLELNSTGSLITNTSDANHYWNNTAPTDTLITLGDYDGINYSASMIAYCFKEIEGFSKFGQYSGNDASNGAFVFTGFAPAFLILKYSSGSAGGTKNWLMFDNKRSPDNVNDNTINANAPDGETADSNKDIDFLSNGFKLRNAEGAVNNAAEYIYIAFAETPFKYANAQ